MKKQNRRNLFKLLEKTASLVTFSIALLLTGNASLAAVLHIADR